MKNPLWLLSLLLAVPALAEDSPREPTPHPCDGKTADFSWKTDAAYKTAFDTIETRFQALPDNLKKTPRDPESFGDKCIQAETDKDFDDCGTVADHAVLAVNHHLSAEKKRQFGTNEEKVVWMVGGESSVTPVQGETAMKDLCNVRAGRGGSRKEAKAKYDAAMQDAAKEVLAKRAQQNKTDETVKMAKQVLEKSYLLGGQPPAAAPIPTVNMDPVAHGDELCADGDCKCWCRQYLNYCPANQVGGIKCSKIVHEAPSCITAGCQ